MNDKQPIVSVIVTTYNREQYLKETIESILNQTFTDFELIVVDNFSNYDFFKTIEGFNDSRIRPFQNQNNGVIAVNRNYGIAKARGKYLAFCDDDDLWVEDKLKVQISHCEEGLNLLCTNIIRFATLSEINKNNRIKNSQASIVTPYRLLSKYPIALSSALVNNTKDVLFCTQNDLVSVEDYELWGRLCMSGYKIKFIEESYVYYRMNQNNTSALNINKVLLPIRRICVLSSLCIKYGIKWYVYVYIILKNIVEYLLKLCMYRKR